MKKEFNVLYKFSDVSCVVEAESQEEAQRIANERLEIDDNIQLESECYDIEVEEVE